MRILHGCTLMVVAVAAACAHGGTAGPLTTAEICRRAEGEAYSNAVQSSSAASQRSRLGTTGDVQYGQALAADRPADRFSMATQANSLVRQSWEAGFSIRETGWAEECRQARERDRSGEMAHPTS